MRLSSVADLFLAMTLVLNILIYGNAIGARDFNTMTWTLLSFVIAIGIGKLAQRKLKELDEYEALLRSGEEAKRR